MSETADRFIESMGRHFEDEGAPRIAGSLLGALMLNPDPCSLDDLADQLKVSKGSISSNARLLEQVGCAQRVNVPGDRRDFYQIAPDSQQRILEQKLSRVRVLLERLREGAAAVPGSQPEVQARFADAIGFSERAVAVLTEELHLHLQRPR